MCIGKPRFPANELAERWTVERAWLQETLDGLEAGNVHIGNSWEGRTNARIADLRRKITNLYQLIKTENTRKT